MIRGILVTESNMDFIAKLNGGRRVHMDALEEPHIFVVNDELGESKLINIDEFQEKWTVKAIQEVLVMEEMD